jgi:hypothetical protein
VELYLHFFVCLCCEHRVKYFSMPVSSHCRFIRLELSHCCVNINAWLNLDALYVELAPEMKVICWVLNAENGICR